MAQRLSACVFGRNFTFGSVKEVLNKAADLRSGDVQAGLCAGSDRERVAAKRVLSQLTLDDLYESPSVPYEDDELTRLFQDSCDAAARRRLLRRCARGGSDRSLRPDPDGPADAWPYRLRRHACDP